MYKDLVVPITGTPGDMDALAIAIDLATQHGAHLTVLELVNLPTPVLSPWGMTPDVAIVELYNQMRADADASVVQLRSQLAKEPISSQVDTIETIGEPARTAAHRAHYGDLTIVAGSIGDTAEADTTQAFFGSLLLESGRPVMVIPPRCKTPMPPKRVLIAWRPTREAARALHDALPLLRTAEHVDLVIVDSPPDLLGAGAQPPSAIAAHLQRHGVTTRVVMLDSGTDSVSAVLLDHANTMRADLLVVGGYGHSRFREWAMGGVTRELLIGASIPVFYSH